jgi:hypothetical protein
MCDRVGSSRAADTELYVEHQMASRGAGLSGRWAYLCVPVSKGAVVRKALIT